MHIHQQHASSSCHAYQRFDPLSAIYHLQGFRYWWFSKNGIHLPGTNYARNIHKHKVVLNPTHCGFINLDDDSYTLMFFMFDMSWDKIFSDISVICWLTVFLESETRLSFYRLGIPSMSEIISLQQERMNCSPMQQQFSLKLCWKLSDKV